MKRTAFTLALLLLAATVAGAQVPRTINYQGRINDGSTPLTGTRTMTLRIYDSQSGANPLYEEQQSVTFSNGIFTVAIGGGTPNGIPDSVTFDRQYWMGVTISGFNSDQELSPRYILRTSPYSFRAVIADSASVSQRAQRAVLADTAKALRGPVELTGTKGVAGLHVTGVPTAIVSDGVDSVSRYLVSGDTAGTAGTPVAGAYYRDNAPMAWAQVGRDGTVQTGFGIDSVVWVAAESAYEVTMAVTPRTAHVGDVDVPQIAPTVTIGGLGADIGTADAAPATVVWSFKRLTSGNGYETNTFLVRFYTAGATGNGQPTQRPFSLTVLGRP